MICLTILLSLAVIPQSQTVPTVPCGVPTVTPITKRIVGGQVAGQGSWPWIVQLEDDLGFVAGSGTILNPYIFVTSAQHFEGGADTPQGISASLHKLEDGCDFHFFLNTRHLLLSMQDYTLADIDVQLWRVYAGSYNISGTDPNEKHYQIRRVVIHPGYNVTSLENDIALVILTQPIAYNDHTRPACLADSSHSYYVGEVCYLAGWGSTESTGNEEILNQLAMPILANSICQKHWVDFLPDSEICAGYENGGKDFCSDDVGSPLMCKDQGDAWYIQGIASSGGDCTKANEPGIFEDVTYYSDWIKQTMSFANHPYEY